jgi:hypothetical protein
MSDLIRREDVVELLNRWGFDGRGVLLRELSDITAVTVQAQIDAAVAAERDRCAKVAETCPDSHWGPWVAAVIRKGEQP